MKTQLPIGIRVVSRNTPAEGRIRASPMRRSVNRRTGQPVSVPRLSSCIETRRFGALIRLLWQPLPRLVGVSRPSGAFPLPVLLGLVPGFVSFRCVPGALPMQVVARVCARCSWTRVFCCGDDARSARLLLFCCLRGPLLSLGTLTGWPVRAARLGAVPEIRLLI